MDWDCVNGGVADPGIIAIWKAEIYDAIVMVAKAIVDSNSANGTDIRRELRIIGKLYEVISYCALCRNRAEPHMHFCMSVYQLVSERDLMHSEGRC